MHIKFVSLSPVCYRHHYGQFIIHSFSSFHTLGNLMIVFSSFHTLGNLMIVLLQNPFSTIFPSSLMLHPVEL